MARLGERATPCAICLERSLKGTAGTSIANGQRPWVTAGHASKHKRFKNRYFRCILWPLRPQSFCEETAMKSFLPMNWGVAPGSKVARGRKWPTAGARARTRSFEIYRYDPEPGSGPRIDVYDVDRDDCGPMAVSYTHLDVYKRQIRNREAVRESTSTTSTAMTAARWSWMPWSRSRTRWTRP